MTVSSEVDGLAYPFWLVSHLELYTPESYKSCTTH